VRSAQPGKLTISSLRWFALHRRFSPRCPQAPRAREGAPLPSRWSRWAPLTKTGAAPILWAGGRAA